MAPATPDCAHAGDKEHDEYPLTQKQRKNRAEESEGVEEMGNGENTGKGSSKKGRMPNGSKKTSRPAPEVVSSEDEDDAEGGDDDGSGDSSDGDAWPKRFVGKKGGKIYKKYGGGGGGKGYTKKCNNNNNGGKKDAEERDPLEDEEQFWKLSKHYAVGLRPSCSKCRIYNHKHRKFFVKKGRVFRIESDCRKCAKAGFMISHALFTLTDKAME